MISKSKSKSKPKKSKKLDIKDLLKRPYHLQNEWKPIDKKDVIEKISEQERKKFEDWIIPKDTKEKEYFALPVEEYDESKDYSNDCKLTQGDGGSGKSWELKKQYIMAKNNSNGNVLVIAYTHSAVENNVVSMPEYIEYQLEQKFKDDNKKMTDDDKKQMENEQKLWMNNIRKDSKTIDAYLGFEGASGDKDKNIKDWTSQFEDTEISKYKTLKVRYLTHLFIDEYSMVSKEKIFHLVYRVRQQNQRCISKLFGDIYQCPSTDNILHNLMKCQALRNLLQRTAIDKDGNEKIIEGYIIHMKYREDNDNQRCDKYIRQNIDSLKKTGKVSKKLYKNHEQKHKHKTRYTRWITQTRKQTIINNATIRPPTALRSGDVVICAENQRYEGYDAQERPILNENLEHIKIQVFNNERLVVIRQTTTRTGTIKLDLQKKDGRIIKNVSNRISYSKNGYVQYLFALERSETAYKYQGMTIKEEPHYKGHYIIQEAKNMSLEMFITAYTRAKKFKQIYLDDWKQILKKKFVSAYADKKVHIIEKEDMKKMNYFQMYLMTEKRENEPNLFYVGQVEYKDEQGTKRSIYDRRQEHIDNTVEVWSEDCEIELIGHYLAHNRQDAEKCEAMLVQDFKYMDKYKGWTLVNQTYADKKGDDDKFSNSTGHIRYTINDYIKRLFPEPYIDTGKYSQKPDVLVCKLQTEHFKNMNDGAVKTLQVAFKLPNDPYYDDKPRRCANEKEARKKMRMKQEAEFEVLYPYLSNMLQRQAEKERKQKIEERIKRKREQGEEITTSDEELSEDDDSTDDSNDYGALYRG